MWKEYLMGKFEGSEGVEGADNGEQSLKELLESWDEKKVVQDLSWRIIQSHPSLDIIHLFSSLMTAIFLAQIYQRSSLWFHTISRIYYRSVEPSKSTSASSSSKPSDSSSIIILRLLLLPMRFFFSSPASSYYPSSAPSPDSSCVFLSSHS